MPRGIICTNCGVTSTGGPILFCPACNHPLHYPVGKAHAISLAQQMHNRGGAQAFNQAAAQAMSGGGGVVCFLCNRPATSMIIGKHVCNGCLTYISNFYPGTRISIGESEWQKLPALENGGIRAEDLIGWRIWRVCVGFLQSYSQGIIWEPNEPMEGKPGDHDHVGVWAFREQRRAIEKMLGALPIYGIPFVYGSVRLWGDVVEHTDGYRAQYARILSIDGGLHLTPDQLADIRRRYGVTKPDDETRAADRKTLIAVDRAVADIKPLRWERRLLRLGIIVYFGVAAAVILSALWYTIHG